MSDLKFIGAWMANLRDAHLPLPQELVGDLPEGVRDQIGNYLAAGTLFRTYRGLSWCRFRCGVDDREIGFREYTDGEWAWPEGLVHYVRVHDIVLPEDFIASATSGRLASGTSASKASFDFWIEWASARRSAPLR